jgi:hypothetical protein
LSFVIVRVLNAAGDGDDASFVRARFVARVPVVVVGPGELELGSGDAAVSPCVLPPLMLFRRARFIVYVVKAKKE